MKNKKIVIIVVYVLGICVGIICSNIFLNKQTKINDNIVTGNFKPIITENQTELQTDYPQNYFDTVETEEITEYNSASIINGSVNKEAFKAYTEFIKGERCAGNTYIDDFTIPTKEPNKRRDTSYAFWDCNHDGINDLHIDSERDYYIISYRNNDLFVWQAWTDTKENFKPLNDGNFLTTYCIGYDTIYNYYVFDINGNKIFNTNFKNQNLWNGNDYNTKYSYEDIDVTKELYDALTKKYFEIGDDKIEWTYLYHDYYDGKNHYDKYNHNDE